MDWSVSLFLREWWQLSVLILPIYRKISCVLTWVWINSWQIHKWLLCWHIYAPCVFFWEQVTDPPMYKVASAVFWRSLAIVRSLPLPGCGDGRGLMLLLLSGPLGFACWISFTLVFNFMFCWVLIFAFPSFYWRFIHFRDLYVLGDEMMHGFYANQTSMCLDPHLVRLAPWNRFKFSSKYFTDRSKAVLILWITCVIYVLCLSCFHVCSLLPSGHLWERADLIALVCDA